MKVKDIVLSAAKALGIEKGVSAFFDENNGEFQREAELLLSCFNNVECALALDYIPLYAEDTLRTVTERLDFSAFSHAPVRIVEVKDTEGNLVEFTLFPKYLKAGKGTFRVTYTYTPDAKTIEDESDFGLLSGSSMLVYGLLAEYSLAEGRFQEADQWDKRYKRAIESTYRSRPCKRIESRRWV